MTSPAEQNLEEKEARPLRIDSLAIERCPSLAAMPGFSREPAADIRKCIDIIKTPGGEA